MSSTHLQLALFLARFGLPVLPLREGKLPIGNCPTCKDNACGGRPNMKSHGPCRCPAPCHAWAAATTDPAVLTSPAWAPAWREAQAVAYHPGGAGLTVLDLDNAHAVAWARATMPATLTVPTTRGEHWIYRGVMTSANAVRPGVDIKSSAAYARWLGEGTGTMAPLPESVRALARKEEATLARIGGGVASSSATAWARSVDSGCRHTDRYRHTGLQRGLAKVREHEESGAGSQAFGVARFLAAQHNRCPGPCGLDTLARRIIDAAVAVGVPHDYATRAVTNGFTAAGAHPI
ncbi:bifunctional DNA primase/polymerase [Kitasatospora sp. NPDC057936]|uniref:bifunctional DNA primase/polymerase n=1 Tax=Kitasatospora sp. NPDC057936 TaxID=3346283 RepID=UPI0036DACADE